MAQIIASTKEISNKRESLIVLSNSLKNKISLLETLGNSLNSMWEGAAKEKYVKQLKTDISKMRNLLKTILEFILILEKIIAIYNKAEKKNEATAVSQEGVYGRILLMYSREVKATASSFQQAGKDVKKTTSDMLQLVRGISSSIWSGEASSIYLGKFNGLDADIAKMCKMIEEESQHLTTIAQEYQLAEEQNKQVAGTLKNNVIAQIVQTG